jgi:hypothetical protein
MKNSVDQQSILNIDFVFTGTTSSTLSSYHYVIQPNYQTKAPNHLLIQHLRCLSLSHFVLVQCGPWTVPLYFKVGMRFEQTVKALPGGGLDEVTSLLHRVLLNFPRQTNQPRKTHTTSQHSLVLLRRLLHIIHPIQPKSKSASSMLYDYFIISTRSLLIHSFVS